MPGIAAAAFAKAIEPPSHLNVSVANRCSNACRRRWNEISVSVAAHSRRANILLQAYFSGNLGCQWMLCSRAKKDLVLCLRKIALSRILVPYCRPHSAGSRSYNESNLGFPQLFVSCLLPYRTPTRPRPRRPLEPLIAYLDLPHNIPYPKFITKPECWWRTLSCVPYLMALQISDTALYFVPLMERHEQFEFLSYYVPGAIRWLLSWFLMVYCFAIYVGMVRNRKWPHYFWHHMTMGLLLENCIQITWYASNFLPLIHYSGTFGLYYWARVGFIFILLLLECMRCALAGRYVNLPFISNAAYIHTPYVRGDD